MRRWFLRIALVALGFILVLPSSNADDKIRVVATFSILGNLIDEIGGEAIALTVLIGPDADTHAFEPTAQNQRDIANAQVLVANGLGLEPWLNHLIEASAFKGDLVEATKGIKPLTLQTENFLTSDQKHDHHHDDIDPHAFQDPKLALIYIDNIVASLAKAAPAQAGLFTKNAAALKKKILEMDAKLSTSFAGVPLENKRVLTSHNAFGYFGRAYGISFVAAQASSTEAEPSAKDLRRIVEQVESGVIKAVFIENMQDPRLIEILTKDTGIVIGGRLYSDALSAVDGPAPDLLSLYWYNAQELLRVLK